MRRIVKPFDWIAALFGAPAFGLMMFGLLNPRGYANGARNADPPFLFIEGFLFIAGALMALTGIIWVLATWGRSSKATRIFGIFVAGLPVLAAVVLLVFPLRTYRRGFTHWTARHVHPEPIRAWLAAGAATVPAAAAPAASAPAPGMMSSPNIPPVVGATELAIADCPADISALGPQYVWLAPGTRGLFLVWADSMWGGGRCIFIGIDANAPAPKEITGWMPAMPGVHVTDTLSMEMP